MTRRNPTLPAFLLLALAGACDRGALKPAELDNQHESCASCRMIVSDRRFAAQLLARSEEPKFFDDIGCLGRFLKEGGARRDAVAYVADHRTRAWVPARTACYTCVPGLETPMGSHLLAHADPASRDADPDARGGVPVPSESILGTAR